VTKISVIGAGAWGTALAQTYAASGHDVTLWVRETDLAETMRAARENTAFLPGIRLADSLNITPSLEEAARSEVLLLVVPAQFARSTLKSLAPHLKTGTTIVLCAKGIEIATGKLLTDVVAEECPGTSCAVLTGPNFAHEIAGGKPSASTIAAQNIDESKRIQSLLSSKNLRLYAADDVIAAEIAGAVKNVIAIACGIVHGLDLGESARAALVTRGLAEIARLTIAMGGKRETLMGQCGVGDMMLTCSSIKSRNFSFGVLMAEGKTPEEILASRSAVTEGVPTAKATAALAEKLGIDMPIVKTVDACLHHGLGVSEALAALMLRPARAELE
jgi:glycerol-3-phosphate dehydrogenase (NAD(P)+)